MTSNTKRLNDGGGLLKRGIGAAMIVAVVVTLDLAVESALHQLWLPLIIALGAYLLTESALSTILATTLLAALHTQIASAYWWAAYAYPGLALAGTLMLTVLTVRRFRTRMQDTHDARWQERRNRRSALPTHSEKDWP